VKKRFNLYAVFGFEWGMYNDPFLPDGMYYNEMCFELVVAETPGKAKYKIIKKYGKRWGDYTDLHVYLIKKNVPLEDLNLSARELEDKYLESDSETDIAFGKAFEKFNRRYGKYERVL